jgi:hypothetical protein
MHHESEAGPVCVWSDYAGVLLLAMMLASVYHQTALRVI